MDIHELMKEYDQTAIDNAEKILNSKEFKKLWHQEVRKQRSAKIIVAVEKWLAKNYLALLSIILSAAAFIKSFF